MERSGALDGVLLQLRGIVNDNEDVRGKSIH
jgi:hypothetical protein